MVSRWWFALPLYHRCGLLWLPGRGGGPRRQSSPATVRRLNTHQRRSSSSWDFLRRDSSARPLCVATRRLQPLSRPQEPEQREIRVVLEEVPREVPVERPFVVSCNIANCSDRNMDLVLSFLNLPLSGVMWSGVSGRQLGSLAPNESVKLPLELVALSPGLQTISGVRLMDTFLKKPYNHDKLAQVLVTR